MQTSPPISNLLPRKKTLRSHAPLKGKAAASKMPIPNCLTLCPFCITKLSNYSYKLCFNEA